MVWLYRAYALVFVVSGAISVLVAHAEVAAWFGPPPGDLLQQYRFLRATEVGYGLLLLAVEPEFFAPGRVRAAILTSFAAIPLARVVGIAIDGTPGPEFVLLLVVELLLFFVFLVIPPGFGRPR
jgi:hypothetical protein